MNFSFLFEGRTRGAKAMSGLKRENEAAQSDQNFATNREKLQAAGPS